MSDQFVSPFGERYASKEMQRIFSAGFKFRTWRRLWVSLAEAERKLGLPITEEQVAELRRFQDDVNFEVAKAREREVRHDVMAHIYAYGQQCPKAAGIIHLGATSCYVGDNTDLIQMREGLLLIRRKLAAVMKNLGAFALTYKSLPTLGYTHLQPAQLTTVGKRAALWLHDFLLDMEEVEHRLSALRLLGSKGTTGTQASFLELFDGDVGKIDRMEAMIAEDFGFPGCVPVSGQTYSRKVDAMVLACLSGIAQSAGKFSSDLRLLQGFKEIEEPFEQNQIGSSAMPYKRNPMRSERIAALSRYLITDSLNPALTASTQWFERTLDDSANRRIAISEGFLAADGILTLLVNVTSGLVVYPKVIERRVREELPFMAVENILMEAVKQGGDRQELHERLRVHSTQAGRMVKELGEPNDLIRRIAEDPAFCISEAALSGLLSPELYTGRSAEQTERFVTGQVLPVVKAILGDDAVTAELMV